ncbi:MAG: hypothetical protein MR019_03255 [Ruminococcus sp.]|nr:hypothetical protein [Ruminococcus sp.]MDY3895241.1 hypothetical protein [Candidatus Fimenecus sp.]
MGKKENRNKEKKIIFSEEIDGLINGLALGLAFVIIGLILTFKSDYFGNNVANTIVQWCFIIIGSLGLATEIPKLLKKNGIQGTDDLLLGSIFFGAWLILYLSFSKTWVNILSFFLLLFGLYALIKGIAEVFYSLISSSKKGSKTNKISIKKLLTNMILLLTQLAGFALVIVQIIKAVQELNM